MLIGARRDECTFVGSPNDESLAYALFKSSFAFPKTLMVFNQYKSKSKDKKSKD